MALQSEVAMLKTHRMRLTSGCVILGVGLIILFIIHNILNWEWYKRLFKGKYSALRIIHTTINIFLVAEMLGLMISGVMLSRTVFAFLDLNGGLYA
jgi:hypothetical protein